MEFFYHKTQDLNIYIYYIHKFQFSIFMHAQLSGDESGFDHKPGSFISS